MTALDKFIRLESGGHWRDGNTGREVTVSFGKATLVLSDGAGKPLAHWSLPAIVRVNPQDTPARYAPDTDATETVEISDDLMVGAIEEVRGALRHTNPKPKAGAGRYIFAAFGLTAIVAVAVWGNEAAQKLAIAVVPEANQRTIGAGILAEYTTLAGPKCTSPAGDAALTDLRETLFGDDAPKQLVVVADLPSGAAALPGDLILVDGGMLANENAAAIAPALISSAAMQKDVLPDVLSTARIGAIFKLLTTGSLPDTVARDYAIALQNRDLPAEIPSGTADLPPERWADLRDICQTD